MRANQTFRLLTHALHSGLFASVVCMSGIAIAQVPQAGALQQQLQREIERSAPRETPAVTPKKDPSIPKPKVAQETIEVKKFIVFGATLLDQASIDQAIARYENRALTFDQIREAANAVTALYTKIGRTAQAVIPPQDVIDGVIKINILEGKVGKVIIELDQEKPSRLRTSVIQGTIKSSNPEEGFVNLIGLERSLALLNEISGHQSTAQITTGDREGSTDIIVTAKDLGLFSGRLELANYGSASTGVPQAIANLNMRNFSGLGDQLSVDAIGSESSLYGLFKYTIPVGVNGWKISAGTSALNYKSLPSFSSIVSKGNAQTYGLYLMYALDRSARSMSNIVLSFENKKYKNFSDQIESSRYQINDFTLGVNGSKYIGNNLLFWGLNAVLGSLNIGNTNQIINDQNGAGTNGSFAKLTFNGAYNTPLPFERTNMTVSVYGQLANKNLNSAEQFYLGGPYGVRAYPVAQGGGSQGAIGSVEISHNFPNQFQLGAFFDAGIIQQYIQTWSGWQGETRAGNVYPLYSTGLTARYNNKNFQISAVLAFRVGTNPLLNASGQQLDVSNSNRAMQAWIKGTFVF